jgi:hypothetical protein
VNDDDDDDDSDFMLRRDFTVRQGSRLRREHEAASEHFARDEHSEPAVDEHPQPAVTDWPKRRTRPEAAVADWPLRRSARRRSVARRVAERLVLGIAALGVATAIWIAPESQDAANAVSMQMTNVPPQSAAGIDTTAMRSTEPSWLSPETLYATAIAPHPPQRPEAPSFLLRPGR